MPPDIWDADLEDFVFAGPPRERKTIQREDGSYRGWREFVGFDPAAGPGFSTTSTFSTDGTTFTIEELHAKMKALGLLR